MQQDPQQWAIVFYIAAAVSIAGNTFFVFFGSGDVQPWDKIEPNENTIGEAKLSFFSKIPKSGSGEQLLVTKGRNEKSYYNSFGEH